MIKCIAKLSDSSNQAGDDHAGVLTQHDLLLLYAVGIAFIHWTFSGE